MAGDIQNNIEIHRKFIQRAAEQNADALFFPELSLTGYEPKLAKECVLTLSDSTLDDFQELSNRYHMALGVGAPVKRDGIKIGMVIFMPNAARQVYFKQHLHMDETPYFSEGREQVLLRLGGHAIAPAICYESLLREHSENSFKVGADIYVASVAKSANGVTKAAEHYSQIAKKYSMTVLMANCIGPCDDFVAAGQSAVWNSKGERISQLGETEEGILIFDTESGCVVVSS